MKNKIKILLVFLSVFILSSCKAKNDRSNEIRIGILMPLSGDIAEFGESPRKGAELYIDNYNAVKGGINGLPIRLISYNDEGDPLKTSSGLDYLLDEEIDALITGASSTLSLAIADTLNENKIPTILTTASEDSITYDEQTKKLRDNIFRVCFVNSYQGKKMANFVRDNMKVKSSGILYSGEDPYSDGLKKAYEQECAKLGIKVLAIENFPKDASDFQSQLTNIVSKKCDSLFVPAYYKSASLIVDQAKKAGITYPIIGCDGWSSVINAVSDSNVLNNCYYCTTFSGSDTSEATQNFNKIYREKNGVDPNMFSAAGYDAAEILISAIENALGKSTKKDGDLHEKIIEALKKTDGKYVTGKIRFDEFNNPEKDIVINKISDGKEEFWGRY